jgi:hypothetical protein
MCTVAGTRMGEVTAATERNSSGKRDGLSD